MAKSLSAFLAQNAKQVDNRKIVVSPRFVDEDDKPIEWEITCVTAGENQKIRKNSTRNVPVNGKRGQYTQDFDIAQYQAKLAVQCTVFPDLNDKELQDSYGVMSAEQLISAMLTPGEFDSLILDITDLCGFTADGELIDEAKN
ncbi:MAG: phage portal protein [Oscillospiraceae bacterium]|nr:phage portal protein [Oscillospiraceae bacterium]